MGEREREGGKQGGGGREGELWGRMDGEREGLREPLQLARGHADVQCNASSSHLCLPS